MKHNQLKLHLFKMQNTKSEFRLKEELPEMEDVT
jgi:hypothetical protein